jgi:hypothetical protein
MWVAPSHGLGEWGGLDGTKGGEGSLWVQTSSLCFLATVMWAALLHLVLPALMDWTPLSYFSHVFCHSDKNLHSLGSVFNWWPYTRYLTSLSIHLFWLMDWLIDWSIDPLIQWAYGLSLCPCGMVVKNIVSKGWHHWVQVIALSLPLRPRTCSWSPVPFNCLIY